MQPMSSNASRTSSTWLVAGLLALLMLVTRGHHVPTTLAMLPSATAAVFLLAGRYSRSFTCFALLLVEAVIIDYVAITWFDVSDFCVSPAYAALLPAYAALWLAGRWLGRRQSAALLSTVLASAVAVLLGTLACELIASGSFYVFSGRFAELSGAGFVERLARYYPASLWSTAFWVAIAQLLQQVAVSVVGQQRGQRG